MKEWWEKNLHTILLAYLIFSPVSAKANNESISDSEMQSLKELYKRPESIPYPDDNPESVEKRQLGQMLFFDPHLSLAGSRSCATCHNPSYGWTDSMSHAVGHGDAKLGRKTPSILNLAWDDLFFWDGRAESLEEQALGPIQAKGEMRMDMPLLIGKLYESTEYREQFKKAFPEDDSAITKENLAKAIATYERSIVSGTAPFDRWINGDDNAISAEAKEGFVVFNKQANCAACHSGWRFSDSSYHDIGLPGDDIGRGKILALPSMQHAFKTVGLRNIDRRPPYMHNGSLHTLEDVVNHYDHGFFLRDSLSEQIKPLHLTEQQKSNLVAFLHTLTSDDAPVIAPVLPIIPVHEGE